MAEENDYALTSHNDELGPDSFGGDEFRLPSEEWLVEGFERNLKAIKSGVSLPNLKTIKIRSSRPDIVEEPDSSQTSLYEQAIISLDILKDELVAEFHKYKADERLFKIIEGLIHKVEGTIQKLGGEVEEFNPLAHMSGLEDGVEEKEQNKEELLLTNAKNVVLNTQKHYTIHSISSIQPKIVKGKPSVILQIEGVEKNEPFKIVGAVVAKDDFFGNEAIDYVRHEGKGRLSIKSFRNGTWQDNSEDFHFAIEERPVEDKRNI